MTTALGTSLVSRLYSLDEPGVGRHTADEQKLIRVLPRMVGVGHNVVVIAAADWVIDLSPEGGADGGSVVVPGSHTGQALAPALERG